MLFFRAGLRFLLAADAGVRGKKRSLTTEPCELPPPTGEDSALGEHIACCGVAIGASTEDAPPLCVLEPLPRSP